MKAMSTLTPIPVKPGQGASAVPRKAGTAMAGNPGKVTATASIAGPKPASAPRGVSKAAGTAHPSRVSKAIRSKFRNVDTNISNGVTPMPGGTTAQTAGGKLAAALSSPGATPLSSLLGMTQRK